MSDEIERRPEDEPANRDFLATSETETEGDMAASDSEHVEAPRETFGLAVRRIENALLPRVRAFGLAALGMCAMVAVALGLAQGLTAGLLSSWPSKIVGVTETTASYVGLDVERRVPKPQQQNASNPGADSDQDARVARIEDIAQGPGGAVGIVPDNQGYLPPQDRKGIANPAVIITVPISQGRLLRFDEAVESVFIADPSIADIRVVSPTLVYVYGKSIGHTNLLAISNIVTGDDGNTTGPAKLTGSAQLRVVADLQPAIDAKNQFSPGAPVDLFIFGTRTGVRGHVRNIDQAVDIANIVQTYSPEGRPPINSSTLDGSNQINIRVRFAEVSRQDLKSFGIDWNVAVNAGSFSFGLQKSSSSTFGIDPNIELAASAGNFDIDLLIEALQNNGALTVLAEPNLTAVTGETASFLAGGEVPVPVPTSQDSNSITVQYKPFGVSLAFMPTIVKQNRIALRVKPEVSSVDTTTDFSVQGFNLPSFTVRRAETVVEVASGQTFALAGLFQREISRTVDKLPVLGDVPVLGPLFRSERYRRNETELVILITPYLVNPISDRGVATPLDRLDLKTSWQADVVGPDPTAKGAALTSADTEGSSGFILK